MEKYGAASVKSQSERQPTAFSQLSSRVLALYHSLPSSVGRAVYSPPSRLLQPSRSLTVKNNWHLGKRSAATSVQLCTQNPFILWKSQKLCNSTD